MSTQKQKGILKVRPMIKKETPQPETVLTRSLVKTQTATFCDDCRSLSAFQAWHDEDLPPSFNVEIDFADWKIIPAGKHAVIELVAASVYVPKGEWARLRMFTSLGTVPSNLDLFLTPQGVASNGDSVFVATHNIRAYSDNLIAFNLNRDNAQTSGHALICISGYISS